MFSPIIWLGFNKWWKKRNDIKEIIKKHIQQWAKEFFCGYNPPYWHNKFWFEVSPNGRFAEHEQITDFESLKEIVEEIHKYWKKIMWNINHWYYTEECWEETKQIIDDFIKVWIDGFIVSNFEILEYLEEIADWKREKWYIINWKKYQLNISTIMAVYNTEAIKFLKENYPIAKIILSRELTIPEIENILNAFPDLLFEVFGEWDFCRYNNGLCFAEHKYTDRDICTVVVNDWIVKKSINYDYRKIVKDEKLSNNEKAKLFDKTYEDEFTQLHNLLDIYPIQQNKDLLEEMKNLLNQILRKYIIFYDPLQWPKTKHNLNFQTVYEVAKILKQNNENIQHDYFKNIDELVDYLEKEKTEWQKQYIKNLEEFVWEKFWIKAKYKDDFYNRSNNLNLFSYVYFDKFKNLDTVKFPTRGRNYLPKLKIIEECIKNNNKIYEKLTLNDTPTRAHYELKYLFDNNKYWFYDLRKKLWWKVK